MQRWALAHPVATIALIGWITGLLVQSGGLGTIDTSRRLQATHALWTAAPHVLPQAFPDFGLVGRDGEIHTWYGLGQSLLMLPADVVATFVTQAVLSMPDASARRLRASIVAFATFPLVTAASAVLGYLLLQSFGFGAWAAFAGVLCWLWLTTVIVFSQNHFENSMMNLLILGGYYFGLRWAQTGALRPLVLASLFCGGLVLVRLPMLADSALAVAFCLVVVFFDLECDRGLAIRRVKRLFVVGLPILLVFVAVDRAYQWYRFEDLTSTYIGVFGEQWVARHPGLPESYPFSGSMRDGILGPLISPHRSIFLYDPMLVVLLFLCASSWRAISFKVRAFLGSLLVALVISMLGYARLEYWDGSATWGNRYTLVPVHLALLVVGALLSERLGRMRTWSRVGIVALVLVSGLLQACALTLPPSVEVFQSECESRQILVAARRPINAVAALAGRWDDWGLDCSGEMPLDMRRIWLLAFRTEELGRLAGPAQVVWLAAIVAFGVFVIRLVRVLRAREVGDSAR